MSPIILYPGLVAMQYGCKTERTKTIRCPRFFWVNTTISMTGVLPSLFFIRVAVPPITNGYNAYFLAFFRKKMNAGKGLCRICL